MANGLLQEWWPVLAGAAAGAGIGAWLRPVSRLLEWRSRG